ncbi:MAG TPA: hypothetical protein VM124_00300 [Candidatus Limnocylindrales bacterium]|nr:hypothetical protein [Candidatus Limnocylindrales bacterium]
MPPLILLALITGLPLVLTAALRVKPLYVFVSVVSGYFAAEFLGDPTELMARSFIHTAYVGSISRIVLLLVPLAVTLFLMRKTLSAAALPFQFVLLVADSLLLATFLGPLLSPGVQNTLYSTNTGHVFKQAHDVLITSISGLHVLIMWVMRPRHHDAHGKHKKH